MPGFRLIEPGGSDFGTVPTLHPQFLLSFIDLPSGLHTGTRCVWRHWVDGPGLPQSCPLRARCGCCDGLLDFCLTFVMCESTDVALHSCRVHAGFVRPCKLFDGPATSFGRPVFGPLAPCLQLALLAQMGPALSFAAQAPGFVLRLLVGLCSFAPEAPKEKTLLPRGNHLLPTALWPLHRPRHVAERVMSPTLLSHEAPASACMLQFLCLAWLGLFPSIARSSIVQLCFAASRHPRLPLITNFNPAHIVPCAERPHICLPCDGRLGMAVSAKVAVMLEHTCPEQVRHVRLLPVDACLASEVGLARLQLYMVLSRPRCHNLSHSRLGGAAVWARHPIQHLNVICGLSLQCPAPRQPCLPLNLDGSRWVTVLPFPLQTSGRS